VYCSGASCNIIPVGAVVVYEAVRCLHSMDGPAAPAPYQPHRPAMTKVGNASKAGQYLSGTIALEVTKKRIGSSCQSRVSLAALPYTAARRRRTDQLGKCGARSRSQTAQ
jgi:hypothetical protein